MWSRSTPRVNQSYYLDEQLQSYNHVSSTTCVSSSLKSISSIRKLLSLSNFLSLAISQLFLTSPCQSLSKTASSIFSRLFFPQFYNRVPRLGAVAEPFPTAMQKCVAARELVLQRESSMTLVAIQTITTSWHCSEILTTTAPVYFPELPREPESHRCSISLTHYSAYLHREPPL